ncbi:FAD-binding protein, partial [Mesorhizobium sp. M2E.F.Ca.ET.154.01.1.1]
MTTFTPSSPADVLSTVQWAVAEESPLEIFGHGSKRGIGRPLQTEHTLDLSKLTGVTLYEPAELV